MVSALLTEDKIDEIELANNLCDCINMMMGELHPQIGIMIRDMDALGKEEANNNFAQYLEENPDEMEQIMQDVQMLEKFEETLSSIEQCEDLNSLLSNENMKKQEISKEKIEAHLESQSNCEYARIFYKLGKNNE